MRLRSGFFLLTSFSAFLPLAHATPSCPLNTASPSVTICSPANGASLPSPVHVNAGTTDTSSPVKLVQIYIDGVKNYQLAADNLDTSIDLPAGAHRLTVQATDTANMVFKSTINITVTSSGGPSPCTLNT